MASSIKSAGVPVSATSGAGIPQGPAVINLRTPDGDRGEVIIDLHQRALELDHVLAQDNLDSPVCIAMQVQLARRLLTDFLQASSQAMREHHLGDPSVEGYVLPPSGDDARGAE